MHVLPGTSPDSLDTAARALEASEVVALPTETVYGLAARALDADAVVRIFEAKGRPRFDPLIVHIANRAGVDQIARVPDAIAPQLDLLAGEFWPGPLTLILPRRPCVPDLVTAGLDTVAVRVPRHPLTLELIRRVGPLAAPSANRFARVSPTSAAHVVDQLSPFVHWVLDGGPCDIGVESTILAWEDGQPTVVRPGGVDVEALERLLGDVAVRKITTSQPSAPGQLRRHYGTRTPLRLVTADTLRPESGAALLVVCGPTPDRASGYGQVENLAPNGSLATAAQRLFSVMRTLDDASPSRIDVIPCGRHGLGRAILDRLERAAAPALPDEI